MGTVNKMESFGYEIQSLKHFRPPKPFCFTPRATGINITPKTRQLPPALLWAPLMSRSLPLDERDRGLKLDLNRWIFAQARRPDAQKANPQPEPDLNRRDEEEEDGDDEAELSRSAEALEHLEAAAIRGDDTGRDAVDYSRRARLFDKSSRVFQDLKERDDQSGGP